MNKTLCALLAAAVVSCTSAQDIEENPAATHQKPAPSQDYGKHDLVGRKASTVRCYTFGSRVLTEQTLYIIKGRKLVITDYIDRLDLDEDKCEGGIRTPGEEQVAFDSLHRSPGY